MAVGRAGQGLPGEPGSGPGWGSRLPHPALCLCPVGVLALLPGSLWCCPAAPPSWLALATGDSLASTQAQATACPSGSLSLSAQGPLGLGSRSGQSGLSPVPEPDGQSADRITASPGPRPPPPTVGPGSCLGRRNPLMGPSTGLPCSARVQSVSLPLVPWAGRVSPSPEPQFPLDDVSVWNCGNLGASSSAGPMAGTRQTCICLGPTHGAVTGMGTGPVHPGDRRCGRKGVIFVSTAVGPVFQRGRRIRSWRAQPLFPGPPADPSLSKPCSPPLSGGDGEPGPGPAEGTLAVAAEEKLGREGGCQPAPWSPLQALLWGQGREGASRQLSGSRLQSFQLCTAPHSTPRGARGAEHLSSRSGPRVSGFRGHSRWSGPQALPWTPLLSPLALPSLHSFRGIQSPGRGCSPSKSPVPDLRSLPAGSLSGRICPVCPLQRWRLHGTRGPLLCSFACRMTRDAFAQETLGPWGSSECPSSFPAPSLSGSLSLVLRDPQGPLGSLSGCPGHPCPVPGPSLSAHLPPPQHSAPSLFPTGSLSPSPPPHSPSGGPTDPCPSPQAAPHSSPVSAGESGVQ